MNKQSARETLRVLSIILIEFQEDFNRMLRDLMDQIKSACEVLVCIPSAKEDLEEPADAPRTKNVWSLPQAEEDLEDAQDGP